MGRRARPEQSCINKTDTLLFEFIVIAGIVLELTNTHASNSAPSNLRATDETSIPI